VWKLNSDENWNVSTAYGAAGQTMKETENLDEISAVTVRLGQLPADLLNAKF